MDVMNVSLPSKAPRPTWENVRGLIKARGGELFFEVFRLTRSYIFERPLTCSVAGNLEKSICTALCHYFTVQVKVCEQRNLCILSLKQTKNAPKTYRHVSLEEHNPYTTRRESPCIPPIPSYPFCLVWGGWYYGDLKNYQYHGSRFLAKLRYTHVIYFETTHLPIRPPSSLSPGKALNLNVEKQFSSPQDWR